MFKCIWVAIFFVMLGMLAGAGKRSTHKPATQRAVNVAELIKRLGSADYLDREKAAFAVVVAYPEHQKEFEEAAKRPGLDPQAQLELQQIVQVQHPRMAALQRANRIAQESAQLNQKSALDSYEKSGTHDPAWDSAAHDLILAFTLIPGDREKRERHIMKMAELADKITKAGCKDPFIRYLAVRSRGMEPVGVDFSAIAEQLKDVVSDLERSNYPAERKCWGHARYIELILRNNLWGKLGNWKDELTAELQQAIKEWPEAVKDPGMNDQMLSDLAEVMEYDWIMVMGKEEGKYGDRAELCDKLVPAWIEAYPNASGPWEFKGKVYIDYAWDARGDGVANTVTETGWKQMRERLQVAHEALDKAYELDPADPRGPTDMITVELGEGTGRPEMEKWWKRAMDASPDNYQACTSKLYYLEPKWYGSPGDMIDFGRECLSGGNWEGRIPFILVDAHWTVSQYPSSLKEDYYAQPDVWKDIQSVYEPFLARYPTAAWDRSYYAYYATRAGQWAIARKQFAKLGDKPELTPFGNQEAYNYLVAKAKAMTEDDK